MPEGPEIRRAADQLAKALVNQPLSEIRLELPSLKPFEKTLSGQKIVSVSSRSKALLTRFEQGLTLYSHNQLYGIWYITPAYKPKNTQRQLRVALQTAKKWARLYSASEIYLLDDEALARQPYLCNLGPDTLEPETSAEEVLARYQSKTFRGRGLPALLLDQHFLAGLGNYLRSEILFEARLNPLLRPRDCSPEQLQALARASLELPRRSYETGGVTNDLARVEQLKQAGFKRSGYRFQVFAREGQPCYACGTPIERIEAGGRRLYWCPRCQAA